MIVEGWHGVFNRKGELLAVEEGKPMAEVSALNLEINSKAPTNKIFPVTIIRGDIIELLDAAKAELKRRQATPREPTLFLEK